MPRSPKNKRPRKSSVPRTDGRAPRQAPAYVLDLALAKFREPVADAAAPGRIRYRSKSEVAALLAAELGKSLRWGEYVAAEADRLIEAEVPIAAADAATARTKLAKRFERLADKAENDKKYSAAAMNAREVGKLLGLYAPKKIHVQQDVNVNVRLDALVAILDDEELAWLERIDRKIEDAKARGVLALSAPIADAEPDGDAADN